MRYRLLRSELLRLRSRLAVVGMLGACIAFLVLLMIGQIATHKDDYAQARAAFQAERTAAYPDELASYRLTLASIGDAQMPKGHREVTLQEYVAGTDFTGAPATIVSNSFVTTEITDEMVKLVAVIMCVVGFLVGATAAGAEWQHRTIHGLLTWESRRLRVLATKVLGVVIAVSIAYMAAQLATVLLGQLGGTLRGTTDGTSTGWWLHEGGIVLRGGLMVALAAAVGVGLAFIGRLTGFAIGLGLVYIGVVESIILSVRPALEPYTIRGGITAFLDGGRRILLPHGMNPPTQILVGTAAAGLTVLVYAAVTMSAATATFLRRDVS